MIKNLEEQLPERNAMAKAILWLFVISGIVSVSLLFVSLYVVLTRANNDNKVNMSYKAGYYDAVGDYYSVLPYELYALLCDDFKHKKEIVKSVENAARLNEKYKIMC